MELPTLPDERGHSRGVRRRVERSFPAVCVAAAFQDVLIEALDRRFGERLRRLQAARGEEAADDGRERYISVPDVILFVGQEIAEKRDAMVRADLALEERRKIRRQTCARRDRIRNKLYKERVKFKKEARARLGRKRWKLALTLEGETLRDPVVLAKQADHDASWAWGPLAPSRGVDGLPIDWARMAAPLPPLVEELRATIDVVTHHEALVIQALEARIWAVQAFDKEYGDGARLLERTFFLVGLPTLATAVRPHLKVAGRVGRPSKTPPVDDFPDLVEQARATGLVPEETAETAAAPAESQERHRLAAWLAAYRQAVVPYLSFLARWSASRSGPKEAGNRQ